MLTMWIVVNKCPMSVPWINPQHYKRKTTILMNSSKIRSDMVQSRCDQENLNRCRLSTPVPSSSRHSGPPEPHLVGSIVPRCPTARIGTNLPPRGIGGADQDAAPVPTSGKATVPGGATAIWRRWSVSPRCRRLASACLSAGVRFGTPCRSRRRKGPSTARRFPPPSWR